MIFILSGCGFFVVVWVSTSHWVMFFSFDCKWGCPGGTVVASEPVVIIPHYK